MQDCLAAFTEAEEVTDFTCEGCGKQQATKRLRLLSCPPVLMLSLKRFIRDAKAWHSKNNARVTLPAEDLDISPFCEIPDQAGPTSAGHGSISNDFCSSSGGRTKPFTGLQPRLSKAAAAAHQRMAATAKAAAEAVARQNAVTLTSPAENLSNLSSGSGAALVTRYNLAAVACHTGGLSGGHCTALTRHPGEQKHARSLAATAVTSRSLIVRSTCREGLHIILCKFSDRDMYMGMIRDVLGTSQAVASGQDLTMSMCTPGYHFQGCTAAHMCYCMWLSHRADKLYHESRTPESRGLAS